MRKNDTDLEEEVPIEGEDKEEVTQRQRQELNSALRNFAQHFGAAEVYRQARAIYQESPAGRAEAELDGGPPEPNRPAKQSDSERANRMLSGGRPRRGSPALEAAKKLLGG